MKDRFIRLVLGLVTIVVLIRLGPSLARALVGIGRSLAGTLLLFHSSPLLVLAVIAVFYFLFRYVFRSSQSRG